MNFNFEILRVDCTSFLVMAYRIRPSRMTSNNKSVKLNFAIIPPILPFLNNAKYLDPSDKTDL